MQLLKFLEYNVKPVKDLLLKREFGFLFGAIIEKVRGQNPYLSYHEWRGKDRFVIRRVRDYEMIIDLYDRGISRHLFIRGTHEAHAAAAYRDALTEVYDTMSGEVTVLDIGANIGYYVLEEADVLRDRGSIVAFEPDPENRRLLKRNVEKNGYAEMVDISPLAADNQSGERIFCRSTHSNWNRLEAETGNVDELVDRFPVETTSIDEYLTDTDLRPDDINAVRMDLEGHELNVLDGMTDVLKADGPLALFVEFHPDFGEREAYESAMSLLEDCGFTVQHVSQHRTVLNINSFEELRDVEGSHVRVIITK